MIETYLFLLAGVIAGLIGAFIGGIILYRNNLRTHLRFRDKVEEERTALYNDIAEIDKEELSETDAGKELLILSQASNRQFGYARENLTTSLRRHNYDLLKQIEEDRKRLAQSEERLVALTALQQESEKVIENLKKDHKELRLANSLRENTTSTNSAQIEQDLRITLEEVARLQNQLVRNVIEDFIQVTTFKADSHILAHEPVDLNSIIQDVIDDTSSEVRAKRLSLKVELPENVASVYADRKALGQILIRLLSNAGAVSPLQGTIQLRVQIKTEGEKEALFIQVSDTGGGIPPEDLGRVFTPLYRAEDVPARGVGDTGMGLFVAKTLTEAQHGKIWVDTELGVGSTYNVLIPIARATPVNVSVDE